LSYNLLVQFVAHEEMARIIKHAMGIAVTWLSLFYTVRRTDGRSQKNWLRIRIRRL